jgi:hypothetical protein
MVVYIIPFKQPLTYEIFSTLNFQQQQDIDQFCSCVLEKPDSWCACVKRTTGFIHTQLSSMVANPALSSSMSI